MKTIGIFSQIEVISNKLGKKSQKIFSIIEEDFIIE